MKKFIRIILNIVVFISLGIGFAFASVPGSMPDGFESKTIQAGEIKMRFVRGGQGPESVILLHGWPQDWYSWHKVMPLLADEYDVIAVDLRGIGGSDKPETGYNKTTMAGDIAGLMNSLNIEKAHIVGHDIGGQTAFAFGYAFPMKAISLTIIDTPIPGTEMFAMISRDPRAWHFAFHAAPEVPERLIQGREEYYLGHFYKSLQGTNPSISEEEVKYYAGIYSDPKTLTAGFNFYRAYAKDTEENKVFMNKPLNIPVLAVNPGVLVPFPYVTQMLKPLAPQITGVTIEGTGHWIAEENPKELVKALKAFFAQ